MGASSRGCVALGRTINLKMICRGDAHAAAIDSNVLRIKLKSSPELWERLRIIECCRLYP